MAGTRAGRSKSRQSRDRILRERVHDPYKTRGKLREPTVCPGCDAVYQGGRWQWLARPENSREKLCPACCRARDGYPGGVVHVEGDYWLAHEQDVVNLIRNIETRQRQQHPLERIMGMDSSNGRLRVETTDLHLARAIGQALHDANSGELDYHYPEESSFLEVRWRR